MDNVATPPPSRNALGFMVPSPKETHSLDPYAFPADEPVSSPRSRTPSSSKPLPMSVHPRTFLPPGNPLPHAGGSYQRGAEFFQQQFSAALHSPVHGSQPSQTEEQFTHPSSRLENDSVCQPMDQTQAMKQGFYQSQPLVPGNGASPSSMFATASTNVIAEKAKKKKKQKKMGGAEAEKNAIQHSDMDSFSPSFMEANQSVPAAGNQCSVDYKVHTDMMGEARGLSAKSPASMLSVGSGDSNSSLPSLPGPGGQGASCFPSTTTAATFTNSLHTVPHNRRLSSDSLEPPTSSRPASRTSTVSSSSGSSEGKAKEAAEPIPMSKILEIIEREKMLGSSSPCKRRRTAKPQHIQVAEEEAKKFAAANATQGVMKDAGSVENLHSSKKNVPTDNASRARNTSTSFLQEKSDSNSRTSSQMSSPGLPGLDACISPHSNSSSNDRLEKAQPQLPVNDNEFNDHLLSKCNKTVVYSESNGSYVDPNPKHTTVHPVTDTISPTFPQTFGSTVSPSMTGAGLGSDGDNHSTFSTHSAHSLTDTAGKQHSASTGTEQSYVHHDSETLILQNTKSAKLHPSSNTVAPRISHESTATNCSTYDLNEGQENTQSGEFCNSQDLSYVDSTHGQNTSPVFSAPKYGQHLDLTADGKASIQQCTSTFPSSSTAESRHQLLGLQNRGQNVFHPSSSSSPSPSSQWLSGSNGNPLPSSGPQFPSPNALLADQDGDFKPSLVLDYHSGGTGSSMYRTQTQTADMISGNDFSLSQQPPAPLSTLPVSTAAAKKPKKKRSSCKPSLQASGDNSVSVDTLSSLQASGDNSVSVDTLSSLQASGEHSVSVDTLSSLQASGEHSVSVDTLSSLQASGEHSVSVDTLSPSSAAFSSQKNAKKQSSIRQSSQPSTFPASSLTGDVVAAGTLPPFGAFAGMKMDGTHPSVSYIPHGSQSQSLPSGNLEAGIQPPAHGNAPPPYQMLTGDAYPDGSFTKDNKAQNALRSGDAICTGNSNMNDLIEFGNAYQNIKQEVTLNAGCHFSNNNNSVSSAASMPGKSLYWNSREMAAIRPGAEQQYHFQASSGEVHQRAAVDKPLVHFRQSSNPNSMKDMFPMEDPSRLDLKPAPRNGREPSLNTPVMSCNSGFQDRTLPSLNTPVMSCNSGFQDRTLQGAYHLAYEKAAHESGMPRAEKVNISNANSVGVPALMTHNTKTTESSGAQAFANNFNPAQRMPSFHSKTPASGLMSSFENGKWSPQEKTSSRKHGSLQEKLPIVMNGLNGKPLTDSQTWKRENSTNGRLPETEKSIGAVMNNQYEKSTVESTAKKMKPGVGMVMNRTLPPDFRRALTNPSAPTVQAPPTPEPGLQPGFTPRTAEEELDDRLRNNKIEEVPKCDCLGPNYEFNESIEGPFYSQLGVAKDMSSLRRIMEERTGLCGKAIRLEKVHYTGKEGRSVEGCPIAKWIIRRSGPEEKYLCVARKRPGHFCEAAYIVMVIVAWDGVASSQADTLYGYLVSSLTKHGYETDRRCGTNERKTCACQGVDLIRRGASFSFGCSWSMYFNRCKFARSNIIRKFKLKDAKEEEQIEDHLQDLATQVAPLYKVVAPTAYRNQVHFEDTASMCRLGKEKGRPFSGVTACVDFCAHSHKDFHNMQNGSTVVVTLTKHSGFSKPEDEQLHVLPLYIMDNTDEHGSVDGQMRKVQAGALEILQEFSSQARLRATPVKKPRRGAKKTSPAKTASMGVNTAPANGSGGGGSSPATPAAPGTPGMDSDSSMLLSQDSSPSLSDSSSLSGNSSGLAMQSPDKTGLEGASSSPSLFVDRENSSGAEDVMSQRYGPQEMYEKVWQYFYSNGVFPPPSYMDRWAAAQKQAMMNGGGAKNGQGSSPQHQPPPSPHPPPHAFQAADPAPSPSPDAQRSSSSAHPPYPSSAHPPYPSSAHPPYPSSARRSEAAGPVDLEMAHLPRPMQTGRPSSLELLTVYASGQRCQGSPMSLPSSPHPQMSSTLFKPGEGHTALPRPSSNPAAPPPHPCGDGPFRTGPQTPRDGSPSCGDSPCGGDGKPVMPSSSEGSFVAPTLGQGPDEPTFTMLDPTVVRCQWQDNKENFHDPGIGGVAIALSHGAVLFEVAKRELHATTALKKPNRYQPTRISLVFYQHKNLNYYHHGYHEYERQLAAKRQERIRKLMEEGQTAEEAEKAVKPGRRRKKKTAEGGGGGAGGEEEEEKVDFAKTSAAQYRYMWDTTVRHGVSLTTDSIITRWIDPQPMVTGPYQRWV